MYHVSSSSVQESSLFHRRVFLLLMSNWNFSVIRTTKMFLWKIANCSVRISVGAGRFRICIKLWLKYGGYFLVFLFYLHFFCVGSYTKYFISLPMHCQTKYSRLENYYYCQAYKPIKLYFSITHIDFYYLNII